MIQILGRFIVSKTALVKKLLDILKTDAFCGLEPLQFDLIYKVLESLRDNISFIVEFPYIDRHYRDTYYTFHSAKFFKNGRNCIRVHIFEGEFTEAEFFCPKIDLNDRYLGFFIVRPLLAFPLGRSLISPKALKANNFVCCLMKASVTLFGRKFEVHGFPHIAQDMETHTCAESSLWCFVEYFGSKYPQYKPLLPSQIVKNLLDNSERRILPSKGLTITELAKCLHDSGFQCLIYSIGSIGSDSKDFIFRLMRIYIESGMPLLLTLSNKNAGHVILAIGHENQMPVYDSTGNNFKPWMDISFFNKNLVFIDDNFPAYQIADAFHPAAHYSDKNLTDLAIESFIVPLPAHVFLIAEKAYDFLKSILDDKKVGLTKQGGSWFTRLLLTGSHSFKQFLWESEKKMNEGLKKILLFLDLPRFIWICELYNKNKKEFSQGFCSGLLIIDATATNKTLMPVLWFSADQKLFTHNGLVWDEKSKVIVPFKMCTYRNNLKGEWNQWKC